MDTTDQFPHERCDVPAIGRRSTTQQDVSVQHTLKRVHEDLNSLGTCCKSTSFSFTVRTANSIPFKTQYYIDETSRRFLETVIGVTPDEFALQFEAFSMGSTSKGEYFISFLKLPLGCSIDTLFLIETPRYKKVAVKADIRRIIRDGLRKSSFQGYRRI